MTDEIAGRHVLTPDGFVGPARIGVADGIIRSITPVDLAPDVTIGPGFVDLQVNGIDDMDVATADGLDWERLDRLLAAGGVTTWMPTLPTMAPDRYAGALARIAAAAGRVGDGPQIAGAHLEGPFLASAGAHPVEHIHPIDVAWLRELPEVVRMVTLAPELDGAHLAVDTLVERAVLVAIGHTRGTAAQARAAIDAGATLATHLFNVMGPMSAREPGVAGAVLVDDRVVAGLIADLVHVSAELVALAFRSKPERIALVTDAVAWRATPGITFDGAAPRLADGTLAGSALSMDRAVANVVDCGVPFEVALRAASTVPARVLDLDDRGTIEVGMRADLVVLDADLRVAQTYVAGVPLLAG